MSIDHSTGCPISKKYTVNQGCMSLSTYFLECGRHVARLRRRRRRRAYAPTNNTASHDNHEKILHGFPFLSRDDYGAPLGGPFGRRSSAKKDLERIFRQPVLQFSLTFTFFQVNLSLSFFLKDYEFTNAKSEYADVLQCNSSPSIRTPRGHQFPAAFLIRASGLHKVTVNTRV